MRKILFVLLINSVLISAQSAGNSGMAFLKFGFSARNVAMGDLGVVSAGDPIAAYYNPALVTGGSHSRLMFTHSSLIQDISNQNLAANFEMFGLPFMLGVNTTSIPGIEIRTEPGEPLSTFDANYFFGSISTGINIVPNISAGATVKFLYENLFSDEASGIGFDFGLLFSDIVDGVNLGASLRNIGSMSKLRELETKLPVDLRIGASYDRNFPSLFSDITIEAGYQKYTDTDDSHIHMGTEILYRGTLALRTGYITGYDSKGLTAGLGLTWGILNFDYAYVPFEYGLGNIHTISLIYNFL
ncbi:PorV/PorQ family protein [Bacteroidota bacterium]